MDTANDVKNILGLHLPTDPRWVDLAGISLQEILTDHAYCEQKAATSCISLIQRYSDKEKLVHELSPIVTEEWGAFSPCAGRAGKAQPETGQATQR